MHGLARYLQLIPFEPRDLLVVLALVILEGLLSCDNAVALALLVRDLPRSWQTKALRYGIIGAYAFRVVAILSATWILRQWTLKLLGGLYLLWVAGKHFWGKKEEHEDPPPTSRQIGHLSLFWSAVIFVELTDVAFSVDSIAASVALSSKPWVLILGGMLGILMMRFAAQGFIRLLEKFPALEGAAFIAVAFIGLKLMIELPVDLVRPTAIPSSPPTYTTAEQYHKQVIAEQPHLFELDHIVRINSQGAQAPIREQMPNKDEYFIALSDWSSHGRPWVHIEAMFSALVVMGIFAIGFFRGTRKEES